MKILLSEEQAKKVLLELKDTKHVIDRLVERCLHEKLTVGLVRHIPTGHGQKFEHCDDVGKYIFTEDEKNELKSKITQIFSYDYNKKSYGVVLQRFDLKNRLKNIKFFGENSKKLAMDNLQNKDSWLVFKDFDDEKFDKYHREKYADAMALIIRANEAVTVMWGRQIKFSTTFFETDFEIKKIDSLIKYGAIRPSDIPENVAKIFSINLETKDDEPEEIKPEEPQQDDINSINLKKN